MRFLSLAPSPCGLFGKHHEERHLFKGKARLQLDAAPKSKFRERSYRISDRAAAAMSSAAGMAFFSRVSLKAMGTFLPATRLMGALR